MAGASDKARFYLEQYVPELQEYERKGIFTREEITSIASKRNDFEHILNARGSKPADYARYATYEMNLDRLRKKRSKRLGEQNPAYSGQRTIFFILNRGTKKFPGDMGLWMQYIQFCQREKANKKLAKVFTNVLRLKPREWGLWVLAAKHYVESQGDMSTARSYLQRGLRFCKDERRLWLEYMRLEMVYLAKLDARRKILGIGGDGVEDARTEEAVQDEDMIALPAVTAEDFETSEAGEDGGSQVEALQKLTTTSAFTGAIPVAIFDAAMNQFGSNVEVAEAFFELIASFDQLPAAKGILQHILQQMQAANADSAEAIICEARLSLHGTVATQADFPLALGQALATIKTGEGKVPRTLQAKLAEKTLLLFVPFLRMKDELDEDVLRVLESTTRRYLRLMDTSASMGPRPLSVESMLEGLRKEHREDDTTLLLEYRSTITAQ